MFTLYILNKKKTDKNIKLFSLTMHIIYINTRKYEQAVLFLYLGHKHTNTIFNQWFSNLDY